MQQYYGDKVHIIQKNKRNNKKAKGGKSSKIALCFLLITLSLVALFCALFYPENESGKIRVNAKTWHYVTVRFSTQHLESELISENTKQKGGGGFILNDGQFLITAMAFSSESDAKSVASSIENASVYPLVVEKIIIPKECDNEKIRTALCVYAEVCERLTSAVNDYDRGMSTDSVAMLVLDKMRDKIISAREGIEDNDTKLYEATCDFLSESEKTISQAIDDEDHALPSRIRYAVCKIIYDRYKLSQNLL